MSALLEEEKFIQFSDSDKWPIVLSTILENLLRSTTLDKQIGNNRGCVDLLGGWKDWYRRSFPALAQQKAEILKDLIEVDPWDTQTQKNSADDNVKKSLLSISNSLNNTIKASVSHSSTTKAQTDKSKDGTTHKISSK